MRVWRWTAPDTRRCFLPKLQSYPDAREKSPLTSERWSMENRNYTVEQWRASKIEARSRSTCACGVLPKKLHLNQDGIKRGRVAHVREFFGCKHVNVSIAGCKFCPVQL